MVMEALNQKAEMWRRMFHSFKENSAPSRGALLEKIKVLQQSIEHLESKNQPVPQSIRDQKEGFEKQLAELA